MEINVYCDESCHLEQDESNAMGIGAVSCPKDKLSEINNRIAAIAALHTRIDKIISAMA